MKNELVKYESEQTRHANSLHALKDKRVLLFALYYLPITLSIYGLNLWLPTIIKQFDGGSDLRVSFLSSVPYLFGIVGLLIIPRSDDRLNDRYGHLDFLYLVGAFAIFSSAWLASPVLQVVALAKACHRKFEKNIQKEQTLANKRIKDIDYEYHSI